LVFENNITKYMHPLFVITENLKNILQFCDLQNHILYSESIFYFF